MWASSVPSGVTDAPRSRHVVSCGAKKLEQWRWTEFETTSNWNAGSNQEPYWHLLVYNGGSSGSASEPGHPAAAPPRSELGHLDGRSAPGSSRTKRLPCSRKMNSNDFGSFWNE